MFAFIKHSGKQFKVTEGAIIAVDKMAAEKGSEIKVDTIALYVDKDNKVHVAPKGAVICEVLGETRGKKVLIFKQRPKKGYRRKKGHRQTYTKLLVKKLDI